MAAPINLRPGAAVCGRQNPPARLPREPGQVRGLNDALSLARGEVVVMSDANTMMDPAAARRLARWFRDPSVGVVCGRLVLVDSATGTNADGLYWKFETYLKRWEARLGALLGANGAIYAIRRSLFPELPQRIAVDDFVIPLLARLRHGCGLVYEPMAIATEETPPEMRSEFSRRSRIGAGGFQSLSLLWPLINPMQGWIAFAFLSQKYCAGFARSSSWALPLRAWCSFPSLSTVELSWRR